MKLLIKSSVDHNNKEYKPGSILEIDDEKCGNHLIACKVAELHVEAEASPVEEAPVQPVEEPAIEETVHQENEHRPEAEETKAERKARLKAEREARKSQEGA